MEATKKKELEIDDTLLYERVLAATLDLISLLADYANFLVNNVMPEWLNNQQRKRFMHDVGKYLSDEQYLYRIYSDNIIRRCILDT